MLWFKPTGWRPKDVQLRFPVMKRKLNINDKYSPKYNWKWKVMVRVQILMEVC